MTMLIASGLQIAGLALTVWGSWLLLKGLFITDAEITKLSDLPVHQSKHYGHGGDCFAALDPEKLDAYKNLYVQKREEERRKGRCALRLFIVGFALQAMGLFFALFPDLLARICGPT